MNKQELAFEKLSKLKVGALFLEMGTGKTKIALDLIASKKDKVNYNLWICPFSAKQEIEAERLKWHPELQIDIVGCETISQSDSTYLDLIAKVTRSKPFIVVDESLKIKNKDAKRTQRILKLGEYAKYKLILNGTPLSKNVLDLWTQMYFLSPKILNMSYNQFKNTYCEYYIRGKLQGMVKKQYNIEHLVSKIRPYIFDSELDIDSKKRYHSISYSLNIMENKKYEQLKRSIIADDYDIDFYSLTTQLQHYYTSSNSFHMALRSTLKNIDGQAIIFVKYLNNIPDGSRRIVGDMNTQARKAMLDSFKKGDFKHLYITYGCGAFGLNLQHCHNVVFASHTFDYAQRIQAEARIYRMGQESDVDYYELWCDVGLERLIEKSLNKKSNLLDEIKKEIEKKPIEELVKEF